MAKEPDKRDDKHDTKAEHPDRAKPVTLTGGDDPTTGATPAQRPAGVRPKAGSDPYGGGYVAPRAEGDPPIVRPNIISPTSDQLQFVVEAHAEVFSPDELSVLAAAVTELKDYEALIAPKLPVNRDVPAVFQEGPLLKCTMGNWEHEPTSYAYEWFRDAVSLGPGAPDYTVLPEDVGATFTCVVTATNDAGSTVAPPSVPLVVTDPGVTRAA
jgi:hypothetical protein